MLNDLNSYTAATCSNILLYLLKKTAHLSKQVSNMQSVITYDKKKEEAHTLETLLLSPALYLVAKLSLPFQPTDTMRTALWSAIYSSIASLAAAKT